MLTFTRIVAGLRLRSLLPGSVGALFALTFFTLAAPMCAAVTTYYVSPSGNDNDPNAGTLAVPFQHIQNALTVASTGDTVTVEDGTYTGPQNVDLDMRGQSITVTSQHGAASTIIDCGGNGISNPKVLHRGFYFHTNEVNATINGLTIKNAYEYLSNYGSVIGGAIDVESGSTVTVTNCTLNANTASSYDSSGGGVYNQGTVTLSNCTITGNTGSGGVYNGGTATIIGCTINSNTGDGIYNGGTATVEGCAINSNTSNGVYNIGTVTFTDLVTATLTTHCTINGNTGSGVYNYGSTYGNHSTATLANCVITNNTGSGIFNSYTATLTGCNISANSAASGGGITNSGTAMLTNCILNGNQATSTSATSNTSTGGGITNSGTATLTNCILNGNTSTGSGGGIANSSNSNNAIGLTLMNCLLVNNVASSGNGGGVDNVANATALMQFCTFSGNSAPATGTQGGALEDDGTATLEDDILWGNAAASFPEIGTAATGNPIVTVTTSDIQGGYSGNLRADPLFANPTSGNYHLRTGSPCLGAGTPITGVTTDLDNNTRANPPTIGAYEVPVANSTVTLTANPTTSVAGQSIIFTATVTNTGTTPTGTITFTIDNVAQTPVTLIGGGTASYSTTALAVGPHTINASYSGDANYASGIAQALGYTVSAAPTTTTLASSLNPSTFGQTVHLTATINGSNPTGTVTFTDTTSGTTLGTGGLSGGTATVSTSSLTVGSHQITASYGGDGSNLASVSTALAQVVAGIGTTTTLVSSQNPSLSGQSVTFTATVRPVSGTAPATGTVQFAVDASSLGSPVTVNGSGQAVFTSTTLPVGTHSVTATYTPTGNFSGSVGTLSQTVNAIPTHAQLLWNNVSGQAALWNINPDGSYTSVAYGPFSGWTAKAVSEAPDGADWLLWTNTNGEVSLWRVTGSGYSTVQYGPYANFAAVSLSIGADGNPRLLWNETNGTASFWDINKSTGAFTHAEYGPYSGWTANEVASGPDVTDLLWTNTNGTASGWRISNATGSITNTAFGPYSGYSAVSLSVGPDDGAHLLWDNTSGVESLWSADFTSGTVTHTEDGPISGWATRAIATGPDNGTRLLWDNTNGEASLWDVTGSGYVHLEFGPYSGWTAVAVSAGP